MDYPPLAGAWTQRTYDFADYGLARRATRFQLRFLDEAESGGGSILGQGPAVDNVVFSGYKYGPVRGLATSSSTPGEIKLDWSTPYTATNSTLDDTRTITYRVWRAPVAATSVWTELTSASGRVSGTTYTDVLSSTGGVEGTPYDYVVQAWDSGTGPGYGELAPSKSYPDKATQPTNPSAPWSGLYTWKPFTTSGTFPWMPDAGTVKILCSRTDTGPVVKTFWLTIPPGGTNYNASITLPQPGTWYLRAEHAVANHSSAFSDLRAVTISGSAILGTPKVPSGAKRNKTFTVSGTIQPRHTSATYLKAYAYRYTGSKVVQTLSFPVKVTYAGQPAFTTKWTASIKLPKAGSWKVKLKHSVHGTEPTAYSALSAWIKVK